MGPVTRHPDPHAHLDAIAWRTAHDRPRPKGEPNHPRNFGDLQPCQGPEFSEMLSGFLNHFYWWKRPEFLEVEPSSDFAPQYRAFLAAVAEFLSHEFAMPVPDWVAKPAYYLDVEWDAAVDLEEIPFILIVPIDERRARAGPEFLRHNIVFPIRGLICV